MSKEKEAANEVAQAIASIGKSYSNDDDEKLVLVTGSGRANQFADGQHRIEAPLVQVISRPVGEDGKNVRGLSPDVTVLVSEVSDDTYSDVIAPMGGVTVDLS